MTHDTMKGSGRTWITRATSKILKSAQKYQLTEISILTQHQQTQTHTVHTSDPSQHSDTSKSFTNMPVYTAKLLQHTYTHNYHFNGHLLDKPRLTSCQLEFRSPCVTDLCIIPRQTKTFNNLLNTIQLSLSQNSLLSGSVI